MTVDQLLARLAAAFPAFTPHTLEAWAPVFRARFARHEGGALAQAYVETLANFSVARSKALFPVPSTFEPYLPSAASASGSAVAGKLDFAGRNHRRRHLMKAWWRGQGREASGGVPEVAWALCNVAGPLAAMAAWQAEPPPLELSETQLRLARHRAISLRRRLDHGPPPGDDEVWWRQIEAIASGWNVAVARDSWADVVERRP